MSQHLKFNWGLKVKDPLKFEKGKHYWIAKGGYRVFPMSTVIDLLDSNRKIVGKIIVKKVEVKFLELMDQTDADRCGAPSPSQLAYLLELDYPTEGQLVTFVYFERIE